MKITRSSFIAGTVILSLLLMAGLDLQIIYHSKAQTCLNPENSSAFYEQMNNSRTGKDRTDIILQFNEMTGVVINAPGGLTSKISRAMTSDAPHINAYRKAHPQEGAPSGDGIIVGDSAALVGGIIVGDSRVAGNGIIVGDS